MRHIDLNDISILQIQLFIAAGNELNYTRAAQLNHVSQPTVSRSISMLEKTLGIQLFVQKNGALRLTPAGRALHADFIKLLNDFHDKILQAHRIQEGHNHALRVSYINPANVPVFLLPLVKAFEQEYPGRGTDIQYMVIEDVNTIIQNLLNYQCDIALINRHYMKRIAQYEQLDSSPVLTIPLTAVMLRTNPLSCRHSITIDDLKNQKLSMPYPHAEPDYYDLIMSCFRRKNIIPIISNYGTTALDALMNMRNDDEVMISDEFMPQYNLNGFVHVDIDDTESGFDIVWQKNCVPDSITRQFVQFAIDYFSRHKF